ncbi:ABC transporter substrate-binding protein [Nitratireductor basaltis]|uniref:Extracellular solute-binding protein n=1 Tax=Nitratireductor basaltis TaxID=472175 RepID=A0A084UAX7_9HYPH|nr:ABC transporter substrate-binding protein [Nitratireductor basaltis]KFB10113.1 Extracellular solute-binding protein [Nitratireductor basaltis]
MLVSRRLALGLSAMAIALVSGAAQAQDKLQIKIGTEGAYPPFNSISASGELEGFDIDIAKALCEQMEAECEFVTQEWDGMIPALQSGKFDAIIASMSITEERLKQVDFTDKYYNTPPAIVVPKDSEITGVTPEDLSGKTIGAQASTTHAQYAETTYGDADVKGYPTAEEYKLDLVNGRLDAAIDDVIVIDEWLKTEDGSCCKIVGTVDPVEEIYGPGIGIAIRQGEDELREKFNAAIKAIRENGTYKEINDSYFTFDVYGG